MSKKQPEVLDLEAMRIGYQSMLGDVKNQLNAGMFTDSIRAILLERQAHIEDRLKELK
jgi:hypothetical protein